VVVSCLLNWVWYALLERTWKAHVRFRCVVASMENACKVAGMEFFWAACPKIDCLREVEHEGCTQGCR
jgi:hypothetical protein